MIFQILPVGSGNNKTNMVIKACDPDSKVMKTGCLDSHSDHYFDGGNGVSYWIF